MKRKISTIKVNNAIKQHKAEIKRKKEVTDNIHHNDHELYNLRAQNKELKATKSESTKHSKRTVTINVTGKKESATLNEPTL